MRWNVADILDAADTGDLEAQTRIAGALAVRTCSWCGGRFDDRAEALAGEHWECTYDRLHRDVDF